MSKVTPVSKVTRFTVLPFLQYWQYFYFHCNSTTTSIILLLLFQVPPLLHVLHLKTTTLPFTTSTAGTTIIPSNPTISSSFYPFLLLLLISVSFSSSFFLCHYHTVTRRPQTLECREYTIVAKNTSVTHKIATYHCQSRGRKPKNGKLQWQSENKTNVRRSSIRLLNVNRDRLLGKFVTGWGCV